MTHKIKRLSGEPVEIAVKAENIEGLAEFITDIIGGDYESMSNSSITMLSGEDEPVVLKGLNTGLYLISHAMKHDADAEVETLLSAKLVSIEYDKVTVHKVATYEEIVDEEKSIVMVHFKSIGTVVDKVSLSDNEIYWEEI